jgi:hypothetical protein
MVLQERSVMNLDGKVGKCWRSFINCKKPPISQELQGPRISMNKDIRGLFAFGKKGRFL